MRKKKKNAYTVYIQPGHHRRLKILAAQSGRSVSDLIGEMVEQHLARCE